MAFRDEKYYNKARTDAVLNLFNFPKKLISHQKPVFVSKFTGLAFMFLADDKPDFKGYGRILETKEFYNEGIRVTKKRTVVPSVLTTTNHVNFKVFGFILCSRVMCLPRLFKCFTSISFLHPIRKRLYFSKDINIPKALKDSQDNRKKRPFVNLGGTSDKMKRLLEAAEMEMEERAIIKFLKNCERWDSHAGLNALPCPLLPGPAISKAFEQFEMKIRTICDLIRLNSVDVHSVDKAAYK